MLARIRNFFWRHRALIGYLLLVGVAVVAIEIHHNQTSGEINRNAARIEQNAHAVCVAAKRVTANQRFVMETQMLIIRREHEESRGDAIELIRRQAEIARRLATLPVYNCAKTP